MALPRGYEWLDPRVKEYFSMYQWSSIIRTFVDSITLIEGDIIDGIIFIISSIENVCHVWEGYRSDFFYMYFTLIIDFHVRFPFDELTTWVLRILNVALTQLHPNS